MSVPAGTAIVAEWNYAVLAVRETARVKWRDAGPDFEKNAVTFRGEERVGFAVALPDAFVEVDIAAA